MAAGSKMEDGARAATPLRLNLGCGKHPMEGWVNVDAHPPADVVKNLDVEHFTQALGLPWDDNTVDEIHASHFIEYIRHPLTLMNALYRAAKPDARATFLTPYGSSDDAWENPTHQRPYFVGTWAVFGQPYWWREDYGYTADWVTEEVHLRLPETRIVGHPTPNLEATWLSIQHDRNVVGEMMAVLRAQKPARPPDRALQETRTIVIETLTPINPWENEVREVGRLQMGLPTPEREATFD